jgi:hypothetical protein
MRDPIRATILCFALLSFLAAGPLASAENSIYAAPGPTLTDQDTPLPAASLQGVRAWLDALLRAVGLEAAPAHSTSKAPRESPSPDPGVEISPQSGPDGDPNG